MPVETVNGGNIFTTRCQTLVNTVNCVGVMGAGIALECRLRYPDMYDRYVELCNHNLFDIGKLWLYKGEGRWILNFPTKLDWKKPSRVEYLERGLEKFRDTYKKKGITSIAFPLLGADKGGLEKPASERIMRQYLDCLPIPVEIYYYDPLAHDELYLELKNYFLTEGIEQLGVVSGIRKQYLEVMEEGLKNDQIRQINQLLSLKGIGVKTVEKLFTTFRRQSEGQTVGNLSLDL